MRSSDLELFATKPTVKEEVVPLHDPLRTPHEHIEDKTVEEIRETAYRRGYQQGVQAVIDALHAGATFAEIKAYTDAVEQWRLREGRYRGQRSKVQPPPVCRQ